MSTHLEEILDKKKKQMEEQGKNWDAERNQWLKKIKGLFDIIEKWISPLEVKGYRAHSHFPGSQKRLYI